MAVDNVIFVFSLIRRKVFCSFLLMLAYFNGFSQMNLSGKYGLMYIPTAREVKDGSFSLGYSYNPISYSLRSNGLNPERVLFANLTILPRLDISVSLLQKISTESNKAREAIGDRQLDVRYLLLREKKNRPSLALVLSNPFTIDAAMLTQALVASKNFKVGSALSVEATLGIGSPYFLYRDESNYTNGNILSNFKWQKKSEYLHNNLYLTGPFAGAKLHYRNQGGIMMEWDSQKLNVGAYGVLWKSVTLQAALLNLDQFMFGSSFKVDLLKKSSL